MQPPGLCQPASPHPGEQPGGGLGLELGEVMVALSPAPSRSVSGVGRAEDKGCMMAPSPAAGCDRAGDGNRVCAKRDDDP